MYVMSLIYILSQTLVFESYKKNKIKIKESFKKERKVVLVVLMELRPNIK